jgi:hypothetical protein
MEVRRITIPNHTGIQGQVLELEADGLLSWKDKSSGPQGNKGNKGNKGDKGSTGATGPAGPGANQTLNTNSSAKNKYLMCMIYMTKKGI